MMKPCRVSIVLSTLTILVTLFASGCIGESYIAECDSLERVSEGTSADEGADPCGNEEEDAAGSAAELEPLSAPEPDPSALCTTPSCNKDP